MEWRDIPGYEGRYAVSSNGKVWSFLTNKELKLTTHSQGYPVVTLRDSEQNRKQYKIHSLVLTAFIGPRPEKLVARHINGERSDNRLENLEWATSSVNNTDTVRHGRNIHTIKTHCPQGHEYSTENTYRYKGGRKCRRCAAIREAKRRARQLSCATVTREGVECSLDLQ